MWLIYNDVYEAEIKLDFVTEQFEDTPMGRFILSVRTFVAEMEREKIRERTERGKRERARRGMLPTGSRAMLGYTYNRETGKREIDPATNPALRLAGELVIDGNSLREVCRIVHNELGIKIGDSTLSHVLSNPAIYGKPATYRRDARRDKKSKNKRTWRDESEWVYLPADVTPATFTPEEEQKIKAVLEHNKMVKRKQSRYFYPLRKYLFCSGCGTMIQTTSHHKSNRRAYRHTSTDCAPPKTTWAGLHLEARAWNIIVDYFASFESIRAACEHLANKVGEGRGTDLLELKKIALDERVEATRDRISKLSIAWSRGRLTDEDYEVQAKSAETDLQDSERQLSSAIVQLQSVRQVDEVEFDRVAMIVASGLFEVDTELEDILDYVEGRTILTFDNSGNTYVTPDARNPKGRRAWELRQQVLKALEARIEIWGEDLRLDVGVPVERLMLVTSA